MKKFLALVLALVLALSLAACSGGAGYQIGIPADATNGGRALKVLESAGIITLDPNVGFNPTVDDIQTYNVGVTIKELKANVTDGAVEKHVPQITRDGAHVTVQVGSTIHPMLPEH